MMTLRGGEKYEFGGPALMFTALCDFDDAARVKKREGDSESTKKA